MIITILIIVIIWLLYRLQEVQDKYEAIIEDYLSYIEEDVAESIEHTEDKPKELYRGRVYAHTID